MPSLFPIPTGIQSKTKKMPIKAVLFDIYGTLIISESGDISIAGKLSKGDAFIEAILDKNILQKDYDFTQEFLNQIDLSHKDSKKTGVDFPEVEIRDIWKQTIEVLISKGVILDVFYDFSKIAKRYELLTNPVFPMPNMLETIINLGKRVKLGIISNAQFYTPLLFNDFTGKSPYELGFAKELSFYSYEYKIGKPGCFLYRKAQEALGKIGIKPENVLFVGNDMLNDIAPAFEVGFKTALFAGDKRSLRMREGHSMTKGVKPDIIITNLQEVEDCIE